MNQLETKRKMAEKPVERTLLLNIPPRYQWDHANGFCGEASIQCIALYYGAWISQHLVRSLNKGEYLLQPTSTDDKRDPTLTLTLLHFTYEEWDWKNTAEPQFDYFCRWMKRSLLRKHPVMFGLFLPCMDYEDYDHIVPAVGIRYQNENSFSPNDKIIYYDLYDDGKIERSMNAEDFGATRRSINKKRKASDGCIPSNIDYGIAITGIVDENQVTLPVHLSVSQSNEPDPCSTNQPMEMDGIVTIDNLTIDNAYILLRYSSYKNVPSKGTVEAILQSNYETKYLFTATDTTHVYQDPEKIISTKSVYYRCLPMPEDVQSEMTTSPCSRV